MINPDTFIQDFRNLFLNSPQCGSWTRSSENCDYGDIVTMSKDCYMCFNTGNSRDAYYCEDSKALSDCIDCTFCEDCELCYECTDCNNCHSSNFCQDCSNSNDINFCYDVKRCKNCIGCVGLRDKEYYIFNKQYTEKDYKEALKNFDFSDNKVLEVIAEKTEELKRKIPRMFTHQFDTQNCTGDYIYHSKNSFLCFDTRHTEDSGYIFQANLDRGANDSYDCTIPTATDLCYDTSFVDYLFNCDHIYWCSRLKDCEYCTNCFDGEHLFGCNYLNHKTGKFYILNQEVDKDFYHKTTKKIKKILLEKGIYTIHDLLYKDLSQIKKNIDNKDIHRECIICNKKFELNSKEVEFYEKKKIVYPVYCFSCRMKQRYEMRNQRKVSKRTCDACKNTLITTYDVDSKYIVYCLKCYWKHID